MSFLGDAVIIDDDDEDVILLDIPPASKRKERVETRSMRVSRTMDHNVQSLPSRSLSSHQGGPVNNPQALATSTWNFPLDSNYILIGPSFFNILDSPPPESIVKTRDASVYVVGPYSRRVSIDPRDVPKAVSVATAYTSNRPSLTLEDDELVRRSSSPSSPTSKRCLGERRTRDSELSIDDIESAGRAVRQVTVDDIQHYIPHSPIVIEDDEPEFLEEGENGKVGKRRIPGEGDLVIDLEELEDILLQELDAREREATRNPRRSTVIPPRNVAIKYPFVLWDEDVRAKNGEILRRGKVAEVQGPGELRKDATFLYITAVIKNVETGHFTFRGHSLLRARDLNGILSKKCNELVWTMEVDLDDPRNEKLQSLSEVALCNILGTRDVRFTNQLYPNCSFRDEHHGFRRQYELDNFAPLVVRWKFMRIYLTAKDRHNNRGLETSLEHLREGDVIEFCPHLAINDLGRRDRYRGYTTLGGAHIPGQERQRVRNEAVVLVEENEGRQIHVDLTSEVALRCRPSRPSLERQELAFTNSVDAHGSNKFGAIDLTESDSRIQTASFENSNIRTILKEGQKYTYGDSFAGGGGATRGALSAGLEVRWGFDHWLTACEAWKSNFPDAQNFHLGADEVVMMGKRGLYDFRVDVLHLSPPCQFFSSAHTVAGKDDDMNSASLFAAGPLLDVARPRIVTLEQTFGLGSPQFRHFHNSLIREFADRGYSIRWKTVALAHWGLPQRRLRLIMVASCPGERLPPFPPQTHAPPDEVFQSNLRLKPFVTANSVLRTVPANAPHHNPASVAQYVDSPKVPWNGDAILPRCMTTSGGQNYHPNGLREFTCAEYAALQGFPPEHKFPNTHVKKIIGNAVPPIVAKVLFSWIRKWLEKEDRVIREAIALDD